MRISVWTMGFINSSMKLRITVVSELGLNKIFYLYPAGWSDDPNRMQRVSPENSFVLDRLVRDDPVLGSPAVMEWLGLSPTPKEP